MNETTIPRAKLGRQGWLVQCDPGPLAEVFAHMAGAEATVRDGTAFIPYTRRLDQCVIGLVDALIHLRYDANRVRLTLADAMEGQDD